MLHVAVAIGTYLYENIILRVHVEGVFWRASQQIKPVNYLCSSPATITLRHGEPATCENEQLAKQSPPPPAAPPPPPLYKCLLATFPLCVYLAVVTQDKKLVLGGTFFLEILALPQGIKKIKASG